MKEDPAVKYGPGAWFTLRRRAYRATTPELEDAFCRDMRDVCENFPCTTCSSHCKEYMEKNPPESYKGRPRGMFIWLWSFQNVVNVRLGKPTVDFETAWSAQEHPEKCEENCGAQITIVGLSDKSGKESQKQIKDTLPDIKLISSPITTRRVPTIPSVRPINAPFYVVPRTSRRR